MTIPIIMRKPSAFLPVVMSFLALSIIFIHILLYGIARQTDEGTAAHLWQLLMALQVPIIFFFAIRWLPQYPKLSLVMLVFQIISALAAITPVYLLRW